LISFDLLFKVMKIHENSRKFMKNHENGTEARTEPRPGLEKKISKMFSS